MNALDFRQPPPQARSLEEAQALIDQLWMRGRVVEELQARIEELQEQLGLDSGASSKPPSSDDAKPPRSGRQRGAQPGRRGQARVGVEEVDHTEPYYPEGHCACGGVVEIAPEPV